MRLGASQFLWQDEKSHRYSSVDTVKLLAKMFRELTHMKPPRGRMGRHLPQYDHICVELINSSGRYASDYFSARQTIITADQELSLIENKGNGGLLLTNEGDLKKLEKLHLQHQSKLRVENTVGSLQDLVQGLMGLGLTDVKYELEGYYEQHYIATMHLNDFVITITEREAR